MMSMQVPTYTDAEYGLTLGRLVIQTLRSINHPTTPPNHPTTPPTPAPDELSDALSICNTCLRSMKTVCERKPTALLVLTEDIVELLLKLGVEKLGDNPTLWEGVLTGLYDVACTVTETLARVGETLLLISPSMRDQQQTMRVEKSHELMPALVQFIEDLPNAPGAFQLRGYDQMLCLIPAVGSPTALLKDFRLCDGSERFVQHLRREEMDCEAEVISILGKLPGIVNLSSPAVVPAKKAHQPGYWLLAPQANSNFECQDMGLDILVQAFETVSSDGVANAIIDVLGVMFPVRPLFGTSNAISIFTALRSRFHDFSFNIQEKAMDLIKSLLLVDPTPWLAFEFVHLCGLFEGASARATRLIVAHLKAYAMLTEFEVAVCDPLIVHHLVDHLQHADERCTATAPSHTPSPPPPTSWASTANDLLGMLGVVIQRSPSSGMELYHYGTPTLLEMLKKNVFWKPILQLLSTLGCIVEFPDLVLDGLIQASKRFVNTYTGSAMPPPTPVIPISSKPKTPVEDRVVYHDVVHRPLILTGAEVHRAAAKLDDGNGDPPLSPSSPALSQQGANGGTSLFTCSLSLAAILTIMRRNSGAKSCFLRRHGAGMLNGVIQMCGAALNEPDSRDVQVVQECLVTVLAIVGSLQSSTAGSDSVDFNTDKFRAACTTSGLLEAKAPYPAQVLACLFHLGVSGQFIPQAIQAHSQCSERNLLSAAEELTKTVKFLEVSLRHHTSSAYLPSPPSATFRSSPSSTPLPAASPTPPHTPSATSAAGISEPSEVGSQKRLPSFRVVRPDLIKTALTMAGADVALDSSSMDLLLCCLDDIQFLLEADFSNRQLLCESGILACILDVMGECFPTLSPSLSRDTLLVGECALLCKCLHVCACARVLMLACSTH